ncbi:hypothetical protein TWF730_006667 [Orbilia blumenaviensis]|uniref:PRP1 splicing factor N-terminal domain-containing protein n=1 Tax=Orbilia blumenaviensis TaxID=1796055 RepID=A0AAV9VEX2_9PEZI
MMNKKSFLQMEAPANYVAGLGRGATGFTTRSDIGPAREGPSEEAIKAVLAKRAQALGQDTPSSFSKDKKEDDDDNDTERYQDPENEVGLFAGGTYDEDDDEADRIYAAVDAKMDKRRKIQREAREIAERDEYERKNPKIQQQFADLKRGLETVSDEDWAALPEVGDLTGRNRRAKQNQIKRFYAVPDSVLAGARDQGAMDTTVQEDNPDGTMTNFASIGAAQKKVFGSRLDQVAASSNDSAGGSTNVDPKGYLTSLNNSVIQSITEQEVGDIKRVRSLLDSVVKTNPKHAPGWIAAARVEEYGARIVQARAIIAKGCEHCPTSEDVWLEAIRLNEAQNAKIIAATAVKNIPKSVRLWIEAARLESDPRAKKRVIRKGLDVIPQSVQLWKEAVNLEDDPSDAKILLARAVELIPMSVELWLALARLESYQNAQAVLNKARKAIPSSHEIWLAAARLQEQEGKGDGIVSQVMKRAIKQLSDVSAMLKREEWIAEAEKCEEEGAILTCQAIIRETLGWELDEDDDRKKTWMEDAQNSIGRGRYETARAIYAYALRVFYNKKSIWRAAADLEKNHGTKEALWALLEKATESCPTSEVLWMMLAKEKWQSKDVDGARRVLGLAFKQNPNNEDIWLAAVKLEAENKQFDAARALLKTARNEAGTARVWIKSVAYERQLGDIDAALELVNEGLEKYPKIDKLWMMKGQIYQGENKLPQAREAYSSGTKACPLSVPLWILASRLEEAAGVVIKARSIMDRARLAVPKHPQLWCESVRVERRAGNLQQAKTLMANALQQCPSSGLLWTELIMHLEGRSQRKSRMVEAIRKAESDPVLIVTIARNFWAERKLDKAAAWFEKAIVADADQGDTWAWYWKFLLEHGTEMKRADVLSKLSVTEPRHGEIWQTIAKAPQNAAKTPEEILHLVVEKLE